MKNGRPSPYYRPEVYTETNTLRFSIECNNLSPEHYRIVKMLCEKFHHELCERFDENNHDDASLAPGEHIWAGFEQESNKSGGPRYE